jgi:hypothetical protein
VSPNSSRRVAEWRILLGLAVAAPFLLTCWVHGDGIGYVAYLRSAVIDRDLDLRDEFEHLASHIESDASGLPARLLRRSSHRPGIDSTFQVPKTDPVTGRVTSSYSIGPALAWAPAYLIAHAITRARGVPDRSADGYGGLYYLAIALSTLGLGAASLLLSFRIASAVAPPGAAFWSVFAMAWATPLVYYLYLAPSYGHALGACAAAAFLLHWWTTRHADRPLVWFRSGLLAGFMFLARWNDLLLALPALVAEALHWARRRGPEATPPRRRFGCAAAGLLGVALAASPQLLIWQYFHGRPWIRYPTPYIGFTPEGLWGTLLSARHGLLVWTPVALLAIAGLVVLVISNSMVRDWWGGASFGMRRLVSGTPCLAVGLAVFLDRARAALARWRTRAGSAAPGRGAPGAAAWSAPAIALAFSVWNLLLLAQYALGMISHSGPVPLATIAANQPRVVARLLELAGEVAR